MLSTPANSVVSGGGKMALFSPPPTVLNVLDVAGILQLIPVYSDLESAKAGILAG